jgi:hypothetical protein
MEDAVDDDDTEDNEEGQSSRLLLLLLLSSPYFSIPSIEGVHLMAARNDTFVIHFAEESKAPL